MKEKVFYKNEELTFIFWLIISFLVLILGMFTAFFAEQFAFFVMLMFPGTWILGLYLHRSGKFRFKLFSFSEEGINTFTFFGKIDKTILWKDIETLEIEKSYIRLKLKNSVNYSFGLHNEMQKRLLAEKNTINLGDIREIHFKKFSEKEERQTMENFGINPKEKEIYDSFEDFSNKYGSKF